MTKTNKNRGFIILPLILALCIVIVLMLGWGMYYGTKVDQKSTDRIAGASATATVAAIEKKWGAAPYTGVQKKTLTQNGAQSPSVSSDSNPPGEAASSQP